MQKKILKAIIICFFLLSLSACTNEAAINQKNDEDLKSIKYEAGKSYVLSRCFWYDDKNVMLVFEIPQEKEYLKLISYNLESNASKILFEGPFSVEYTDKILFNIDSIGYQNEEKAIIYNTKNLTLINKFTKPAEDKFICFSTNLEYLAEACDDGLYISKNNLTGRKKIDNDSKNYISLSWAEDNSKLVYIKNNYRDISIIEIDSKKKQTLVGGENFKYPDGFAELMGCRFLPNNSDILVNILCENNDVLAIIDSEGVNKPKYISENGSITILDVTDHLILYNLDENNSKNNQLICFDYKNDKRTILYETINVIVGASFSPDKSKIFFSTYLDGKHRLNIYELK